VLDLTGPLAAGRLQQALQILVDRHDVLRARFTCQGSEPVQSFARFAATLYLADLSALTAIEQPPEARRQLREVLEVPFDLAAGPPFRFCLFRLARERHLLLLGFHHLVVDGVSYRQIVAELLASYAGRKLPPARLQFQDFAAWQRERVESGAFEASRLYWMERLGGKLPVLDLPTDRPRPPFPDLTGSGVPLSLGPDLRDSLHALARAGATSPFRVFCGGFKVLLHRVTGMTDIILGTPLSGRTHPDLEDEIGFFVTTPALRTDLNGDATFAEVLERVDETVAGAMRHQDYPFDKLLEGLATERDLSRSPVYSVSVAQQQIIRPQRLGDLVVGHWEHVPAIALYELTASETETEAGIEVLFNYRPELFDRTTVARWAAAFEQVLRAAAANPRARISELNLMRDAERHQLLVEWNDTGRLVPRDVPFQRLFAASVERGADRIAAACDGWYLTYTELDGRANSVAGHLIARGMGPEGVVAILAQRGLGFLTAVIGTFKAGAAYLPLDPRHPASRLQQIVAQSRCSLVLAAGVQLPLLEQALRGLAGGAGSVPGAGSRPTVLDLDRLARRPVPEDPQPLGAADHLAYVIYTSGSTGVPKGALLVQRGLVNHLLAMVLELGLTRADAVAQTASQCFDISVWQLLTPLLTGGRVEIYLDLVAQDPEALLDRVEADEVTVLEIVPSLMLLILEGIKRRGTSRPGLSSLRWLIPTGEAVPIELCRDWYEIYPHVPLMNGYGPAECSDDVSLYHIGLEAAGAARTMMIGRPIINSQIYVLDAALRPVAIGVVGELCIGGCGVGRGYLSDPVKTAATFIPDPCSGRAGERLYRAGDLARFHGDGNLEFLSRADDQVKVRGFRIELGEIEAALHHLASVRDAVVAMREDTPGARRLVAYVVPARAGAAPAPGELRAALEAALPQYMIPAAFVTVESLPLSPNGKVDRRALPAPDPARPDLASEFEAPRDPLEEVLAVIWSDVLGVDRVGAGDNFFELGGHSLLAARIMGRVQDAFAVRLAARQIFEQPTVRRLAGAIKKAKGAVGPVLPPLARIPREAPLELSFAQQRMWFLAQLEPGNAAYNSSFAYRLQGPLSVPSLERALAGLAARHESLRTTFPSVDGSPVQRVTAATRVPLAVVDLSRLPASRAETEALRRAEEGAARPCNLSRGPLLQAIVLRLAADDGVLVVLSHHIVLDGSTQLFLDELGELYRAAGPAPELAPLPFQYADFTHWQRQWLSGEVLESQLAYWERQLGGDLPRLQLPTDRPPAAVRGIRGDDYRFTLRGHLGEGVSTLARQHGATLFMALLAALDVLLHRYTGQRDLCVGFPILDRPHPDLEGLIGCFVNTLVVRAELAPEARFADLLPKVRETILDAYSHKDLPFETLVNALDIARDLSRTPIFQVMFVAHTTPAPRLALPELEVSPLALKFEGSRFDLLVMVRLEGSELCGQIEYSKELFDRTTIVRLTGHFARLLAGIVADPGARIGELPLLAIAERHQLLAEWNDTARAYPGERLIHSLVEEQAARTPEAVAVIDDAGVWSYAALNARANRIAHGLRAMGVRPGSAVGVHLERSAEMVAALLAVLKAGGAYVPLEAATPTERLRFILAQVSARHLLTSQALWTRLGEQPGLDGVVALDAAASVGFAGGRRLVGQAEIALQPGENPPVWASANDLAYVIFTSGSTGVPKGVAVRHRSVGNLLSWINRDFDVGPDDRVLFVTAMGFDLSVYDMFGLLAAGGSVRVVAERDVRDPERLLALLFAEPITFWDSAPAALQQLAAFLPASLPAGAHSLRRVFLSGDWIPTTLPDRFRAIFPEARMISLGGATEATVWSNVYAIGAVDPRWTSIPYGRPMPNARYHLLDERFEPCPLGVAGDLYIAGDCLATGYAAEPALTAESWLPDPFSGAGERLYRTGDRARRLGDGNLEFLGRRDQQVKVRGFRVELGEIEAVLAQHAAVREAVVIADRVGEERSLVAYVVLGAAPVATAALQEHLAARLPEYMVPAAIVTLAELPMTPNGKVDRKSLPRPDRASLRLAPGLVVPRTATEAVLARMWSEVLESSPIGVHDDFFDLGGHSLLATRLVSRIREVLRIDLPLRVFFEGPTIANLARGVEAAHGMAAPLALPDLVPRAGHDASPPLSFAQQRLWFLDQLAPGATVYNLPFGLRFRGCLDAAALGRSVAEVVRRHETLRTLFLNDGGRPRQVIRATAAVPLPRIDLRGLPAASRDGAMGELAARFAARSFDLAVGPLVRLALAQLSADEHLLLVNLHHIVSDGWSVGVFLGELGALYAAFAANQPSPLAELAVQYADFALWQRGWLVGTVLAEQLAYWRQRLTGAPPALALPSDRPRPKTPTYRGGCRPLRLAPSLVAELRQLGRRHGATLFMSLLAAFQSLVAHLTGETDIPVGSPIANRRTVELEGLIGFFANNLVLRGDLGGDPGFGEHLASTREAALGAYAHQDVPFEQLVEELAPARDLSRFPLFQVVFSLQSAPPQPVRLVDLEIALEPIDDRISKFDLALVLTEAGEGLEGELYYSRDLFDASSVERLAGRFGRLVEQAVADPQRPLSRLLLLSDAERHQLRYEWNGALAAGAARPPLHHLFAAQAAERADRVAVSASAARLTYGELDRRANGLARRLRELGVRLETPVGLCVERSLEMIVGILGILKSGGAYVPLDPSYPADRLAWIVGDALGGASPRVVVAQAGLAERLKTSAGAAFQVIDLEDGRTGSCAEAPEVEVGADNLAYLIYTSGSTGRPKSVAVTHGNVGRLLTATEERFGFGPADVWTLFHSYAFDFSVWEMWGALAYGGHLVVVPRWMAPDLSAVYRLLERERVTVLNQTPSAFRLLAAVEEPSGAGDLALRVVVFGGEALEPGTLKPWAARHGEERPALVNMYGITETTVHVTHRRVREADMARSTPSPVGAPIADLSVYLLGRCGEEVPIGAPGEVHVGGPGVARGYWNRPRWTAQRFVPDPFSGLPGSRLYRAGDLARRQPDGDLVYLGRVDDQVKIRGFRVEPGEIEAILAGHEAVREAAVLMREEAGDRRLVAYVVPSLGAHAGDGATARRDHLREHLRQRLPEYMVPTTFLELDAFPYTPSGKLDRRALAALSPAPRQPAVATAGEEVPFTPYLVAGIFSAVLGCGRVGLDDDFFDLGGHSLLATQVVSRLRKALGIELPLREVFERSTVSKLAARVAQLQRGAAAGPPLAPAATEEERRRAPLSFAQGRLWIIDRMEPGNPAYNVPAARHLRGRLDAAALRQALDELVRRQAALRTRFELVDGEPFQVVEPPRARLLPVVDLSRLEAARREAESRRQSAAEARRPFDLTRGPLLRALLLRLDGDGEKHVLVTNLHHIVADGWSVNLFHRELAILYSAAAMGLTATLPALPVQYTDFARWQRRSAAARDFESQVAYWRRQLAGAPALLELPVDRPRPPVQTHRGGETTRRLPAELCVRLRELARNADATFFMTLLAGFEALLLRWTGQGDLAIGTPVANRNRTELEGLIGFFVNTLVLRTAVAPELSFAALLARVRGVAIEAYSHQDLPFEHLVDVLEPRRDLRYSPLFQVMFTYHQSTVARSEMEGLEQTSLEVAPPTAKFDLTLFLYQDEQGLAALFEYNTDLFDGATVVRLARQLETLLAGIAARPEQRLCDLPVLAPEERAQLLQEWNDTAAEAAPRLAGDLVAAQAAATPDAVAAQSGADSLSFAELERKASQLAHHLRVLGVAAETPVGLCLDRCLDLLPAILGIWKAGGAFVPLPPDHPPQRLAFLLEDARIRMVVTRTELAHALPVHSATLVRLDADAAAIDLRPDNALPESIGSAGLAYILYTSGSTGRPKGTLISHGGLANYLRFCHAAYPLEGGAPVYTSLSFDLTLTSLLAPLAAGRPVTLLPEDHALETLAAALRPPTGAAAGAAGAWGFVKLTPAHLELLNRELAPAELAGRARSLLVGGEALRFEALAPWRLHAPAMRLINEYGPTEAVVGCSVHEVRAEDPHAGAVPIGRPITGARLYVLGSGLVLSPAGSPGELCVAGAGLARGYLGRPDLTAEGFVPDPFSPLPGGRLYRTGDRARYRADGLLEYLGRLDQQVKLHGYRIEPGEIESVLRRHIGVRDAAVVVRDDLPGGRGLAIYWVPAALPPVAAQELRRFLSGELPGYMVPAAFTPLAELPLNGHGKVDHRALPAPERTAPALIVAWAAPEDEIERTLATAVAEILRLPRVGRDDNFFDLGANSLTLVLIHERLRGIGWSALTVIDLFRYPSIRGLAGHVGRRAAQAPVKEGAARTETRAAVRDARRQRREQREVWRSS
jgi:amino acid adenylation domain-containing protein